MNNTPPIQTLGHEFKPRQITHESEFYFMRIEYTLLTGRPAIRGSEALVERMDTLVSNMYGMLGKFPVEIVSFDWRKRQAIVVVLRKYVWCPMCILTEWWLLDAAATELCIHRQTNRLCGQQPWQEFCTIESSVYFYAHGFEEKDGHRGDSCPQGIPLPALAVTRFPKLLWTLLPMHGNIRSSERGIT